MESAPTRVVHHANALEWLELQGVLEGVSMITSLPDISEFPNWTLDAWRDWFTAAAGRVLTSCAPSGITLFYQTDITRDGVYIDKSFLCQTAARNVGQELIFHKIICRAPPGSVTYGRPGFAHLVGFSEQVRPQTAKARPDVLEDAGSVTWTRGMGIAACRLACQLVVDHTQTRTIIDPFCGHGGVLAVANQLGLNAVGVEINRRRAARARSLTVEMF